MSADGPPPEDDEFAEEVDASAASKNGTAAPPPAPGFTPRFSFLASVLAAALALGIFATPTQLNGALLYDDKAAILGSPVVQGQVPLSMVWTRDFWGKDDLVSKESHKSFRPLVTLTYKLNHYLDGDTPYGYHVLNACLHALVSALVVPVTIAALGWRERSVFIPLVAGLLFAAHPVHVESVQNGVGRAEVMMALFYLLGFLLYAHVGVGPEPCQLHTRAHLPLSPRSALAIAGVHCLTLCALLCKETGVTLPVLCAAWDALVVLRVELRQLGAYLRRSEGRAAALHRALPAALARYALLAVGCVWLALWRKALNGDTEPEFARKQNMAVFHPHPLFRVLSVVWVWMEYMWVTFVPLTLSCDWSYPAISTIDALTDARAPMVGCYLLCWAGLCWRYAARESATRALVCTLFGLAPFFLASNVLVAVGTCKAERVLYLPSLGGCMFIPLALTHLRAPAARARSARAGGGGARRARAPRGAGAPPPRVAWLAALAVCALYAQQCRWYADIWTTGVRLWEHAMRTQESRPAWMRCAATTHAIGEYGLQLSWANRNVEAQALLERQIRISHAERARYLSGEATSDAGGAAADDTIDMGGYGPLALVYRMNGDVYKAIATADRAIGLFEEVRRQGKEETKKRELGMVLAARALALWHVRPELAVDEMKKALMISNSQDIVVLKLAEQLQNAIEKSGWKPGGPGAGAGAGWAALQQPAAAPAGGALAAADARAPLTYAQLSADPELAAMLASPTIQAVLRELSAAQGDTGAVLQKYAHDAEVLAFARRLPGAVAAGAGAPQQPAPDQLPASLDELEAWAGGAGGGGGAAGGSGAAAAAAQLPPELGPQPVYESWAGESESAQQLRMPRHAIEPVPAAAQLPADLGPLPGYATGAYGAPLDTQTERDRVRPAAAAAPAPALSPPLPQGTKLVPKADLDSSELLAAGARAFGAGSQLANAGQRVAAVEQYRTALESFGACLRTDRGCRVGIADVLFIMVRMHGGAGNVTAARCAASLAQRVLPPIESYARRVGDGEAAEYVRALLRMMGEALQADPASLPRCAEAEATGGRELGLEQQVLALGPSA